MSWGHSALVRGDTFIPFQVTYARASAYAFVAFPCTAGLDVYVRKSEPNGVSVHSTKAGSIYWMAWGP